MGENIIFVGGAPRSGTSLIQRVLDSHPLIFGGPEFDHISSIVKLRNTLINSYRIGRIKAFISEEQINNVICHLIEDLLYPAMLKNKKQIISEKTPVNVLYFEELAKICKKARFVFVMRDPRAIVASMKEVKKRYLAKGEKPPRIIRSLKNQIDIINQSFKSGYKFILDNNKKGIIIKYESLLKNPKEELIKLCDFLEIPFNTNMLYPNEFSEIYGNRTGVELDGIWYTKDQYYRNLDINNLNKWSKLLNKKEIYMIEYYFINDEILHQSGYNLYPKRNNYYKTLIEINKIIHIIFSSFVRNRLSKRIFYFIKDIVTNQST